jgi:outer membrane immunogenic protein
MKRFLLACTAVALCTGAAFATDLPAKAPIYKASPAYSWSGLYGGIHGGYGWGENRIGDSIALGAGVTQRLEPSGGFGGVQIGYNNHFAPHWLIGGEVDFSAGDIHDDAAVGGTLIKDKFDFFGTARTRFGYVQDHWLVYGTAGAIWLQDKYRAFIPGAVTFTDSKQYHVGWVFGGGIEYAIDQRWSWKIEYLYAPLDRSRDNAVFVRSWDPNFSLVRFGLNYRFADGSAPAAYMPVKAAAPRSSWSGSYIGLHGGYGWGKMDETLVPAAGTASLKPDGWYGGFQGGYNWLFAPNSLLGLEVDSSFGNLKDSSPFTLIPVAATGKIENLGTARLRLGYLVTPDTLLYATGGAAYAREKFSFTPLAMNTKVDHLGWTVGGGVEYKFAPEWSLKAEYLYADLGTFKDDTPVAAFTRHSDITLNTVRVGLNYSGPVIERFFAGR